MMDPIAAFIHARQINSFQKLIFLLFLYQHPEIQGTSQEFGTRLYLGNTGLTDKLLTELEQAFADIKPDMEAEQAKLSAS